MKNLGLAAQTLFAELTQRALDTEFDSTYDERGSFVRKRIDGPLYWYYQWKIRGKIKSKYVGPVRDKDINERVKKFNEIKSNFSERRKLVRALHAFGLESPDPVTGAVTEALWKAGFFRMRGVLVGTAAFQCYAGILGVKLSGASLMTQDLDAAQFYDISQMVNDSMPPILDVLRGVDDSFTAIPDLLHPVRVTRFRSKKTNYIVEFLTPNRGSDENARKPAEMPALGGASAKPLRYLDHLIYEPVRSVALYKGGVPVLVPAPERFAIHKLILASQRSDNPAKLPKDIMQASQIIEACLEQRSLFLFEALIDAWARGPAWRKNLKRGIGLLETELRDQFIFTMQSYGWSANRIAVNANGNRTKKTPKRKTQKRKMLK